MGDIITQLRKLVRPVKWVITWAKWICTYGQMFVEWIEGVDQ